MIGVVFGLLQVAFVPVQADDKHSSSVNYRGIESSGPLKETIKLSERARKAIGLEVSEVKKEPLSLEIATLGQIEAIATRSFLQHALLEGRVTKVMFEIGSNVKEGEVLAVLDSPEVNRMAADTLNLKTEIEAQIKTTRSQYDSEREQAEAQLQLARANYDRMETLYKEKISSEKSRETALTKLQVVQSQLKNLTAKRNVDLTALQSKLDVSLRSSLDRLRQVGIGEPEVKQMLATKHPLLKVPVRSTRSGIVTKVNANPGETVSGDDALFEILDLNVVWAAADVYEDDMDRVKIGQRVLVKAAALPHKEFKARLTFIGSQIDPKKRTLPVKVEIQNKDLLLKPDMFVELFIETDEPDYAILLPRSAVVEKTGHFCVFVEVRPGIYQLNRVEIGRSLGDKIEVMSGLELGKKVVTTGAFQLDAHMLKTLGNTDLFSHPSEQGHAHHEHEEGEEHNSSPSNPLALIIIFATMAFMVGCALTAVILKRSKAVSSKDRSEEERLEPSEKSK